MLDTAEPKGQGKDRDRPTDPELRCLALTREDFGRLVEVVGDGYDEEPNSSQPKKHDGAGRATSCNSHVRAWRDGKDPAGARRQPNLFDPTAAE
jgi:hypothetical protein